MTNDYRRVPGDYDLEHYQGRVDPELLGTAAGDAAADELFRAATPPRRAPRGFRSLMWVGMFEDGTTVRLDINGWFDCRRRGIHKGQPCKLIEVEHCRFHENHNLGCDECGGFLMVADNETLDNERQVSDA